VFTIKIKTIIPKSVISGIPLNIAAEKRPPPNITINHMGLELIDFNELTTMSSFGISYLTKTKNVLFYILFK